MSISYDMKIEYSDKKKYSQRDDLDEFRRIICDGINKHILCIGKSIRNILPKKNIEKSSDTYFDAFVNQDEFRINEKKLCKKWQDEYRQEKLLIKQERIADFEEKRELLLTEQAIKKNKKEEELMKRQEILINAQEQMLKIQEDLVDREDELVKIKEDLIKRRSKILLKYENE